MVMVGFRYLIGKCFMRGISLLMRSWMAMLFAVVVVLLLVFLRPPSQPGKKAIGVEAVSGNNSIAITDHASVGSAGLFIGVNEFSEDKGLAELDFAVNDAIELAYMFVCELNLIPASNCILSISGAPTTVAAKKQLAILRRKMVEVTDASKPKVLASLKTVCRQSSGKQDMAVVSFSTHGFEDKYGVYIMPADGMRSFLADTAIYSGTVKESLVNCKAGKKLLILDTCRERVGKNKSSGMGLSMSLSFHKAFSGASGFATLMSCSVGQFSYEDPASGHGVFSNFLLKALRGESLPDSRGFITVGTVSEYVSSEVRRWIIRNQPNVRDEYVSTPSLSGSEVARQIPLAVGRNLTQKQIDFARKQYLTISPVAVAVTPAKIEPVENVTVGPVSPINHGSVEPAGRVEPLPYSVQTCDHLIVLNSSESSIRSILRSKFTASFDEKLKAAVAYAEEAGGMDGQALDRKIADALGAKASTMIVCSVITTDQGEKEVYGRKMAYYAASMTVKIYDVNSRRLLATADKTQVGGSQFPAKAKEFAVIRCADYIAQMVSKRLRGISDDEGAWH